MPRAPALRRKAMALELDEATAHCPYCGERLTLLLEPGDIGVAYVEDCRVCCRPMVVSVVDAGDGAATAVLAAEHE